MKAMHNRRTRAAAGAAVLATVLWTSGFIMPAAVAAEYSWQVIGGYEDVYAEAGMVSGVSG